MELLQPADGAILPLSHPVVFSGTAGPVITQVRLIADQRFPVGEAAVVEGRWTVARQFSAKGVREINVCGLDDAGTVKSELHLHIDLRDGQNFGYTPPAGVLPHLGGIAFELELATPVSSGLLGMEKLLRLPGGQLFIESDLDLDTDGERDPGVHYESTHQDTTTLHTPDGRPLNSNKVPFFVLPGPLVQRGVTIGGVTVKLGDIAAVLYRGHLEFAVFADIGPRAKIGEGSLALHRALGCERLRPNGTIRDVGIDNDVVTLIFPGSGDGTAQTPDAIRERGRELFVALGGVLNP